MAVALRSSSKATSGGAAGTTYTINKPAGTADGDLLIMVTGQANNTALVAPSGGWTLLEARNAESATRQAVYYKWASGEPASYTITYPTTYVSNTIITAWTGVHTTQPFGDWRGQASVLSTDRRKDFDPVWAGWTGGALVGFNFTGANSTQTAPAGYTKIDEQGSAGSGACMVAAHIKSAAPTKGKQAKATWTSGAGAQVASWHLFLRPSGVTNTTPSIAGEGLVVKGVSPFALSQVTPKGIVAGDLLVLLAWSDQDNTVPAATGWTAWTPDQYYGTGTGMHTMYRVADGTSADYPNMTWVTATKVNSVLMYRIDCAAAPAASQYSIQGGTSGVTSIVLPSITTPVLSMLLMAVYSDEKTTTTTASTPSGMTAVDAMTGGLTPGQGDYFDCFWSFIEQVSAGATGTRTTTLSDGTNSKVAVLLAIPVANLAPYAPTLLTPIGTTVFDRASGQRFDWDFSDVNVGDTQSKYDLDYRLVGAGAWTTVTTITPNTYHDFAPGFFAAGDYEWRVRTYDAAGLVGPYSASEFFTAGNVPTAPAITAPTNGSTISASSGVVTWTVTNQTSYQVRKVADLVGSPDTGTVYYDSGEVVDTPGRSAALTYPVNGRWEHIQVRVKYLGLWSAWASVRVMVSYTVSPLPTLTVTADPTNGRMTIVVNNPAPTGGQPNFVSGDLLRSEDGVNFDRIATMMLEDATYYDYTARAGIVYQYRAGVYGDNDTYVSSISYASPVLALEGTWIHDPDDVDGTIHQFLYNDNAGDEEWSAEMYLSDFAGRVEPFAEFGEGENYQLNVPLALETDRDDINALRALCVSKKIVCLRDSKGRKLFTVLPKFAISPNIWGARTVLQATRVHYVETV